MQTIKTVTLYLMPYCEEATITYKGASSLYCGRISCDTVAVASSAVMYCCVSEDEARLLPTSCGYQLWMAFSQPHYDDAMMMQSWSL